MQHMLGNIVIKKASDSSIYFAVKILVVTLKKFQRSQLRPTKRIFEFIK